MRPPAVTVVIPTFDWSSVLRVAIGTVLAQRFADLELLVVGDGCTDDSADVVEAFARTDPRVRWIGLPSNAGTQAVPNRVGLAMARGDVVAYLGHDDLWLPDHLEVVVGALADDPAAAVVHTRACLLSPGRPPALHLPDGHRYEPGDWIPPTATAHRREAAEGAGGWRRPEDCGTRDPEADLWARMHAAFGPARFVDRVTALKLPASARRGVYAERPSHEQEAWATRIAGWSDPEAELRALVAGGAPLAGDALEAPAILADPTADAGERHRVRRRFKGLPSAPGRHD